MSQNIKNIFVIRPFRKTPSRTKDDLDSFFAFNIKKRIENENSFKYKYIVSRSGDAFGMTEKIINDLYSSDIVICDLSGKYANPNVMFELGIRLSISNKPVILIREEHESNQSIFDIHSYFTQLYNPHQYNELEEHIIKKIKAFESNEEIFKSPVLKTLSLEPKIAFEICKFNAHQRSRMVLFGLLAFVEQLQIETESFLKENGNEKIKFNNTIELINALNSKRNDFKNFFWEDFPEILTSLPAMGSILIDFPASGYIPDEFEIQLIMLFSRYYYFATNFYRTKKFPKIDIIYILLHDGLFLEQIIQGIMLLINNISEREQIIEAIQKSYNSTILKFEMEKDFRIVNIEDEID